MKLSSSLVAGARQPDESRFYQQLDSAGCALTRVKANARSVYVKAN